MTSKRVLVWCLSCLCLQLDVGESSRRAVRLPDGDRCDFRNPRRIHNATDLLRCVNELVADTSARDNGRSQPRQAADSSARRENPYGFSAADFISSLLSSEAAASTIDAVASYYQLNRPSASSYPSDQSGGFGVNLVDALSSISRYDDLKCVPRILCEVASGRRPGRYKQTSAHSDDLARNAFAQWLAALDVTGTSPLLNFVRAAALGYNSGGDPATCYRAFPRCPRNPDKLVHYLNNHNGGFFRFFSGRVRGSHPHSQTAHSSRDRSQFLRVEGKAPPPGYVGAEAVRTGTGELKFDVAVLSAHRNYLGQRFLQVEENPSEASARVVFPVHEEPNDRPLANGISEASSEPESSDVKTLPRGSPFSFPRELDDQNDDSLRVRTHSERSHDEFRFPREAISFIRDNAPLTTVDGSPGSSDGGGDGQVSSTQEKARDFPTRRVG